MECLIDHCGSGERVSVKATEANLLDFMSMSKQQFVIPIFQRSYDWGIEECQQLWEDIHQVAEQDHLSHHFVGSVIYIHEGIYHQSSPKKLLVIDGQQRLTTISLLLLALAKSETSNPDLRDDIFEDFLINKRQKGANRYKLLLTRGDREVYRKLVDEHHTEKETIQLVSNYEFFRTRISQSKLDAKTLFEEGAQRLFIVDVALEWGKDDPQRIFESMNTTGLGLDESDKIRNFVLMNMSLEKQEELFTKYWFPMEQRFVYNDYVLHTDWFLHRYLTSKLGRIPLKGEIYPEFKKFSNSDGQNIESVLSEIETYSRFHVQLHWPDRCDDPEIRRELSDLRTLDFEVIWPMLLELFDDYERYALLSKDDFVEILQLVESYLLRRFISRIPTNTQNTTFATFLRHVDKGDYLASVKRRFLELNRNRRFPNDLEFQDGFVGNPLYLGRRERLKFLLGQLENHNRKEPVPIDEYTIEHIFPQGENPGPEWLKMLDENLQEFQERQLHTIGNLTLTGYNSEMSDHPFRVKRDIEGGFKQSPLWLNRRLGQLGTWNEREVGSRARRLFKRASQIWPYPQLDE